MTEAHPQPVIQWRAGPDTDILWARLGDDFVIYHRPSALTHLLNEASHDLLTRLLRKAHTAGEVALDLGGRADADVDPGFLEEITDMLEYFEHLGLVERV